MKCIFTSITCLFIIFSFSVSAQVVNTEKLRKNLTEKGWAGKIDLNFGLTRNTIKIIRTNPILRFEYYNNKNRIISFSSLNLSRASTNFVNDGYTHLRYNYEIIPYFIWEGFAQAQYNEIQLIGYRQLVGTGPRFKLWDNDTTRLYGGLLYMYDYEESRQEEGFFQEIQRDHRLSMYLSFGYALSSQFSFEHISYYQPRLFIIGDFRVATETSFNIKLNENLGFSLIFSLWYDGDPPKIREAEPDPMSTAEVREAVNLIYTLSNSLSYNF